MARELYEAYNELISLLREANKLETKQYGTLQDISIEEAEAMIYLLTYSKAKRSQSRAFNTKVVTMELFEEYLMGADDAVLMPIQYWL